MALHHRFRHNIGQVILENELRVGLPIHLSCTNFGCYWTITHLERINGILWMTLKSYSGKYLRRRASYARHIRRNER